MKRQLVLVSLSVSMVALPVRGQNTLKKASTSTKKTSTPAKPVKPKDGNIEPSSSRKESGMQPQLASWRLTGGELLAQITSNTGLSSIVALKIQPGKVGKIEVDKIEKVTTLIYGGKKPAWSTHRNFIAFYKGRNIWLANRFAQSKAICPEPQNEINLYNDPSLYWDAQGEAFVFERSLSYGSRLLRIGGIIDTVQLHEIESQNMLSGLFTESIVPLAKRQSSGSMVDSSNVLSVENVSFDPQGEQMVAQMCPVMPYSMGLNESRLYIFDLITERDLKKYEALIAKVEPGWFLDGTIPNIKGPAAPLLKNNGQYIDSNPIWSPDGSRIAFTRVDKNARSVYLCLYNLRTKMIEYRHDKNAYGSIAMYTPLEQWSKVDNRLLSWGADGKYLLSISGARDTALLTWLEKGKWETAPIIQMLGLHGLRITHVVIRGDYIAWVDTEHTNRINIKKIKAMDEDAENAMVYDLPPGSSIEWLNW